jgi:hypothetical protein
MAIHEICRALPGHSGDIFIFFFWLAVVEKTAFKVGLQKRFFQSGPNPKIFLS